MTHFVTLEIWTLRTHNGASRKSLLVLYIVQTKCTGKVVATPPTASDQFFLEKLRGAAPIITNIRTKKEET